MMIDKVYIVTRERTYRCSTELSELLKNRAELSRSAGQIMRDLKDKPDHLIYYYDKRDDNDNITEAWMYYDLVPLTDEQYYDRTANINGYVGAYHAMR